MSAPVSTSAQRRVLERPVVGTPEASELQELRAYLAGHCWPFGNLYCQCILTFRFLLHVYGGTVRGGWPGGFYPAADALGSGDWFEGECWHHCWLEQGNVLLDLTSGQFRHVDGASPFVCMDVSAAVHHRVRRWLRSWAAVHGG